MAMSLVTAYDEPSYTTFLQSELGKPLEAILQWDWPASYYPVVEEVCIRLGIDDPSGESDLEKLRGLGRLYLWELVSRQSAALYDHAADGASFNRSRVREAVQQNLARARQEAQRQGWIDLDRITPLSVTYATAIDPYQTPEE